MSKFQSIPLSRYFNARRDPADWNPSIMNEWQLLPAGHCTFWGIPFELGPCDDLSWLVISPAYPSVSIPISQKAGWVVLTHFCDSDVLPKSEDQPVDYAPGEIVKPGEHLATYRLVYENGSQYEQSIRRRFEINQPLTGWGRFSFAARPNVENKPLEWRGPYPARSWGWYQSSVGLEHSAETGHLKYWIYALENPHPELEIAAIRLESAGPSKLAVAGITLYSGKDNPLRHQRLASFRVNLPEPEPVEKIDATVDLGTIARVYTVPAFDPQAWLTEQPQGWGEEALPQTSTDTLFLDVTANSNALLQVNGHAFELEPVFESGNGQSQDGRARIEFLNPRKTWLKVKVVDQATGLPTPARVHFRDPGGIYFPPYGHRHEVNDGWFEDYGGDLKLGSTQYAYVDGNFQAELPVGEVYCEIAKGFEYQPIRQRLSIQPGQQELILKMQNVLDWRKQGWVTADTHVHFISPQTAWLEAQGEGVNLVNILASQWGDLFTNVADITGDVSRVSRDDTLIYVGTENRQHMLGHISLLGGKGSPVYPMCAGGPDESYLGDPVWKSMADWADECREREGLVVIPHFPFPYSEVAADIVLGKIDAAEVRTFNPSLDTTNVREWYRYLNCGYRVAVVGGTDKMSAGMPVGGVRTYAYLGENELTFPNWAKAVRSGNTFTTSGPLIDFKIDGKAPGREILLHSSGGTVEVEARVQSVQPFHDLQILVNGNVVESQSADKGVYETSLKSRIFLKGSSWIAARCLSRYTVWHIWPIRIAAHTSPVYVRCGDQEVFNPSDATFMMTMIEGGLTWLDTLSIPAGKEQQAHIRSQFESARDTLNRRISHHNHAH
jgi:hypothetical protein